MENNSVIRKKWFIQQVETLEKGGFSKVDISKRLDVLPQYLNGIVKGNRGASEKFTAKLCTEFGINQNDLLNQYKTYQPTREVASNASEPKQEPKHEGIHSLAGVPLIPIEAMAGFGAGDVSVMNYDITDRYVVPDFTDVDFMIRVKGNSMYPKYSSGDVIACKKLPLDTFIQWNKVHVLDTTQGAMVKRVKESILNDSWLLVSDNQSYPPFNIPKNDVHSIAIVVGVIRLE